MKITKGVKMHSEEFTMKITKKTEIVIPEGYEVIKFASINELSDSDYIACPKWDSWKTIGYLRSMNCLRLVTAIFHEVSITAIRKKLNIYTAPGSFYIFKSGDEKISWYLDSKGWYAINCVGEVSRTEKNIDDQNHPLKHWLKTYKIVFSHDAGKCR